MPAPSCACLTPSTAPSAARAQRDPDIFAPARLLAIGEGRAHRQRHQRRGVAPASRRISGRTTRTKVTKAATGLPGRPTKAALVRARPGITPIATGRPGLMATRQNTRRADRLDRARAHDRLRRSRRRPRSATRSWPLRPPRDSARASIVGIVGQDAEIGDARRRGWCSSAGEQIAVGVVKRRARGALPGSITSSPVENSATRSAAAHRQRGQGRARRRARRPAADSRRPAGSAMAPARMSSPAKPPVGAAA